MATQDCTPLLIIQMTQRSMTDVEQKLDQLIQLVISRNQAIQVNKTKGSGGWIAAFIMAIFNFVCIIAVKWYADYRSRELAQLATAQELRDKELERLEFEKQLQVTQDKIKVINEKIEHSKKLLELNAQALKTAQREHELRLKKIEGLKTWDEINKA